MCNPRRFNIFCSKAGAMEAINSMEMFLVLLSQTIHILLLVNLDSQNLVSKLNLSIIVLRLKSRHQNHSKSKVINDFYCFIYNLHCIMLCDKAKRFELKPNYIFKPKTKQLLPNTKHKKTTSFS